MATPSFTPNIIFEDEHLIVINKPAWQLSVPGKDRSLVSSVDSVAEYLGSTPHVVHRLDCATSGIMVFAKTKEAQRTLHHSFRERRVSKIYHAVLCSKPKNTAGTVNLPLMTDWPQRPKQKVDFIDGKDAFTTWQIENKPIPQELMNLDVTYQESILTPTPNTFTLVQLRPKTGRTHQLRVHMAAIGHPLLGDRLYASPEFHSQPDNSGPFPRLYLHASQIFFQHPKTARSISFTTKGPFR